MHRYLNFSFLICIFFTSCTDYHKDLILPADVKSFFDFKEGSWWIYKNDSLNEEQKISVYKYNYYTGKDAGYIDSYTYSTDKIEIYFKVSDTLEYVQNLCYGDRGYVISCDYHNIRHFSTSQYDLNAVLPTHFDNLTTLTLNDKVYNDVLYIKSISYKTIDSIYIHKKSIDKVNVTKADSFKLVTTNFYNEYWFAKNYWIVKKIIRKPTGTVSWTLKECKIVQN